MKYHSFLLFFFLKVVCLYLNSSYLIPSLPIKVNLGLKTKWRQGEDASKIGVERKMLPRVVL